VIVLKLYNTKIIPNLNTKSTFQCIKMCTAWWHSVDNHKKYPCFSKLSVIACFLSL